MKTTLNMFINARILQQLGHARITRFLDSFEDDLKALNLSPPPPLPATHFYFGEVADFFANTDNLPARLLQAVAVIETAAAPEHAERLNALIQAHIPDCTATHHLDRALELWFNVPEALACFAAASSPAAAKSDEGGSSAAGSAGVSPAASSAGSMVQSSTVQGSAVPGSAAGLPITDHGLPIKDAASHEHSEQIINHKSDIINSAGHPLLSTLNSKLSTSLALPPGWIMEVPPSPDPVDPRALLDLLRAILVRFVILPKWAAEALALWIVHTYVFEFRDVTTYIGLESPIRRCGKSTLVTILSRLVNRPVISSNVSSPAMFHAIEEIRPTLMIDETDTFLKPNAETQGILNAGYHKPTAYVLRVSNEVRKSSSSSSSSSSSRRSSSSSFSSSIPGSAGVPAGEAPDRGTSPARSDSQIINQNSEIINSPSSLAFFSCWCPKVISRIGRLPETLADRCIVIRMQRKVASEKCERIRKLDPMPLRRQCARFALDHAQAIADATPQIPESLNDRAADIWEPLLAIADLAGGDWPQLARDAALGLSGSQETSPVGSLLLDIWVLFMETKSDRLFTRDIIYGLTHKFSGRPWSELHIGKQPTEIWLAQRLRQFGIGPRTLRINDAIAKGYHLDDFRETFRRYISKADFELLKSTEFPT